MNEPLQIDVVSDVICPWCFIGKRRLDRVVEEDEGLEVSWRPYQLDPTLPAEGMDRREYLRRKFGEGGDRAKAIYSALSQAGDEAGIRFAFDRIARTPNTLDCHRLIRWAGSAGCQDAVVEALFVRYFELGVDVGAAGALVEVALDVGMDSDLVADLLGGDADRELVEREAYLASRMGIEGVPCFIVAGRYALIGAQEPATLMRAFEAARGEARLAAGPGAARP